MFWKVTNILKKTLKTKKEIWRGSSVGWLAPKNFGERRIHNHHGGQVRRGGREFNSKEYKIINGEVAQLVRAQDS